ncbi:MAG: 2-amino-4-hydroxy-6-hydroxymethyldihydropteridine diphosphokinase [Mariprofundales bacterium]|nr:2-amino-4-hydroxy-6-hydroxymethyldihydropteridine diphosphokinase [Mariprofundales bacterium]
MGANLGAVTETLVAARAALMAAMRITACSSLYRTHAVGPGTQPDYLNAVVAVTVEMAAVPLLCCLHAIEHDHGRQRDLRWGARTLDLDLLAYDAQCSEDSELLLPHPRLQDRMFVLAPLGEIAPDWQHPQLQTSASVLKQQLMAQGEPDVAPLLQQAAPAWYTAPFF